MIHSPSVARELVNEWQLVAWMNFQIDVLFYETELVHVGCMDYLFFKGT